MIPRVTKKYLITLGKFAKSLRYKTNVIVRFLRALTRQNVNKRTKINSNRNVVHLKRSLQMMKQLMRRMTSPVVSFLTLLIVFFLAHMFQRKS